MIHNQNGKKKKRISNTAFYKKKKFLHIKRAIQDVNRRFLAKSNLTVLLKVYKNRVFKNFGLFI